jgi:hypothetical protein
VSASSARLREQALDVVAHHMRNPRAFVRDSFGVEPTAQQGSILDAIAPRGAHVSVRSGHGVGKTTTLAWLVIWFLCLHDDCKVPCTAPSSHQLFDLLWAEIAKWSGKLCPFYRRALEVRADRAFIVGNEKTRFAVARTARKDSPEALQGFHADNLLFLIDEASGVDDPVFEVAEGALSTPGARVLLCANPTRTDGYFFNTHNRDRASWTTLRCSSLDSPLVAPEYGAQIAAKYGGTDSNVYRVRVLGEFPLSSDDVLIPLDWATSAVDRPVVPGASERIAGLDVARFGDDSTALVIRHGGKILHVSEWRGADLMQTCGKVVAMFRPKVGPGVFDRVHVDSIGLGAGVVDRLMELGVPVLGVNVAETSPGDEQFNRLRDQLWWLTREWFGKKDVCIDKAACPTDLREQLIAELCSVRYGFTSSGKTKVEGKDEMKARGLVSPNLADALCLTFAEGRAKSKDGRKAIAAAAPVSFQW